MKKKIISTFLCALLLFTVTAPVTNADEGVQPCAIFDYDTNNG